MTLEIAGDRVELWDADDFDPWDALRWPTVRVLRYRQHHRDGTLIDAYWLTHFPATRLSTPTLWPTPAFQNQIQSDRLTA